MKASKPYFSHDIAAKFDEKIIRLMFNGAKNSEKFTNIWRELVSHALYGIYWEIIEYLHENRLKVDELEMLSDTLRVDKSVLEQILNNFDLFQTQDGEYISERVLRNLKLQEEKKNKAKRAASNRWRGEGQKPPKEETGANEAAADEAVVNEIIQTYNKKFNKEQKASKETKERIYKIHTENKLKLEDWDKVFANAKRGWDIGDKKNVPPSFKKILDEWDSFASGDYFLAPDREKAAEQKQEQKQKEHEQEEQARAQRDAEHKQREADKKQVKDKETAIVFLNKYHNVAPFLLRQSNVFKSFSQQYKFTVEDVTKARGQPAHNQSTKDTT